MTIQTHVISSVCLDHWANWHSKSKHVPAELTVTRLPANAVKSGSIGTRGSVSPVRPSGSDRPSLMPGGPRHRLVDGAWVVLSSSFSQSTSW